MRAYQKRCVPFLIDLGSWKLVAFSTISFLVTILQQSMRIFKISRFFVELPWRTKCEQNEKEHKKQGQKQVSKVTLHCILFGGIDKKQTVIDFQSKDTKFNVKYSYLFKKSITEETGNCARSKPTLD